MTRKKKCLECASELTVVVQYVPESKRQMQRAYACFKCGIYDANSIGDEVFREIGGHIYQDQLL
jgi:hypothetical protein